MIRIFFIKLKQLSRKWGDLVIQDLIKEQLTIGILVNIGIKTSEVYYINVIDSIQQGLWEIKA